MTHKQRQATTTRQMFFAAALMLSAAVAEDHISHSAALRHESFSDHKASISPERRFNLEALISASLTSAPAIHELKDSKQVKDSVKTTKGRTAHVEVPKVAPQHTKMQAPHHELPVWQQKQQEKTVEGKQYPYGDQHDFGLDIMRSPHQHSEEEKPAYYYSEFPERPRKSSHDQQEEEVEEEDEEEEVEEHPHWHSQDEEEDEGEEEHWRSHYPYGEEEEERSRRPYYPYGEEVEERSHRPYYPYGEEVEERSHRPYYPYEEHEEEQEEMLGDAARPTYVSDEDHEYHEPVQEEHEQEDYYEAGEERPSYEVHHHHYHQRSPEETEALAEQLRHELEKRHLGHKFVRRPFMTTAAVQDIMDTKVHSQTQGKVVETLYDDLSKDRITFSREKDLLMDQTITFIPAEAVGEEEDDGVVRTFIDRYHALLTHDSALMEEIPAPHFMHQSLLLHPALQDQHHQEREYEPEEEWQTEPRHYYHQHDFDHGRARAHADLEPLVRHDHERGTADYESYHEPDSHAHYRGREPDSHADFAGALRDHDSRYTPAVGQLIGQPYDTYDIDKFYHVKQERDHDGQHAHHMQEGSKPRLDAAYHKNQAKNGGPTLQDKVAKEGTKQFMSTLGMHLKDGGAGDTTPVAAAEHDHPHSEYQHHMRRDEFGHMYDLNQHLGSKSYFLEDEQILHPSHSSLHALH